MAEKCLSPPSTAWSAAAQQLTVQSHEAGAGAPSSGWLEVTADLTFGFSPCCNMDFAAVCEALLLPGSSCSSL